VVVVKRGDKGCYITDGKRSYEIPAYNVKVVDTTEAGDAFNTGFLYGYLRGKSLEECGRLGNYIASLCIQKVGARTGLPYSDKIKI
jgi:ribokinase